MHHHKTNWWNKFTGMQANVWLTALVAIIFFGFLAALNQLAYLKSDTSQAALRRNINTNLQNINAAGLNSNQSGQITDGTTRLKLVADPPQVAYSLNGNIHGIYLTAQWTNASNCVIMGPTPSTDENGLALSTQSNGVHVVVGNSPSSPITPNYYIFSLACQKPDGTRISTSATPTIVTFFDPHNAPQASLTALEIGTASGHPPLGSPVTNGAITIAEGSGLELDRICTNGQSGYITNADGTILSSAINKTKPRETLLVLHDAGTTPNGIHSNKVYTAHCFSGANNNRQETTATVTVTVEH